jgi:two-component system chemotaxis sensor kinase CheA
VEFTREAVVQVFLAEGEELLGAIEEGLLSLERRPEDPETLAGIFRAAHGLKGNASSLGYGDLAFLAHAVEDVLAQLRSSQRPLPTATATLLLAGVDLMRHLLGELAAGRDARLEGSERDLAEQLRTHDPTSSAPAPAPATSAEATTAATGPTRTLRVELSKLDSMLRVAGEIAIARGRLKQVLSALGGRAAAALEAHEEIERLHGELQQEVMNARLVPLGPLLRPHLRTVRDAARSQGKEARLRIEGREVEVDSAVVDLLREPLLHLVRNAVAHGIETPDARGAAGKDPCGTITLSAQAIGGTILLSVEDDGAGFDRERMLQRGRELDLPLPERPSDEDVFRLAFEPGFSTARRVDELAGRGVGMDVVKRNVESLRGAIHIQSRPGQGCRITLRLPLTMAILDGFAVAAAAETFVVPLDLVVESLDLPAEHRSDDARGVLRWRERALPFVRLRRLFGLEEEAPAARESVLVVRHESGEAGLVVDELLGDMQTVVRPLGRLFQRANGISGSTILGSGRVALILDPYALMRQAVADPGPPSG